MQETSQLYKDIINGEYGYYSSEVKVLIGDIEYGMDKIYSLNTSRSVFSSSTPTVGGCVSSELSVEVIANTADIPRMAKIIPYVRLYAEYEGKTESSVAGYAVAGSAVAGSATSNSSSKTMTVTSEWLQKGVYFSDTREVNLLKGTVSIHAYDCIMAAEAKYTLTSNVTDTYAVTTIINWISKSTGHTTKLADGTSINKSYTVTVPATDTSMRNILEYIASAYGGNWITNDKGELSLVKLNGLPDETYYLIIGSGERVTYGGYRIELQ